MLAHTGCTIGKKQTVVHPTKAGKIIFESYDVSGTRCQEGGDTGLIVANGEGMDKYIGAAYRLPSGRNAFIKRVLWDVENGQ